MAETTSMPEPPGPYNTSSEHSCGPFKSAVDNGCDSDKARAAIGASGFVETPTPVVEQVVTPQPPPEKTSADYIAEECRSGRMGQRMQEEQSRAGTGMYPCGFPQPPNGLS